MKETQSFKSVYKSMKEKDNGKSYRGLARFQRSTPNYRFERDLNQLSVS